MNNQDSKASIVLVHGAFADGSSWNKVIPLLEAEGFTVTAVQNPLKSLSEDVATTKRVLDAQKGDVVLERVLKMAFSTLTLLYNEAT